MSSDLRAELVRDRAALAGLEPAWWVLWRRCRAATPFQSPAWLLPWWNAFSPGSLASVAVWDEGELVGLAPLYLEQASARLLPIGIGITDYLDVLLDPVRGEAAWRAICLALDHIPGWQRLSLEELMPGAAALQSQGPCRWSERAFPQSACPVLFLPEEHGPAAVGLAAVVPAGKLRKLRMARNRVARRTGEIERADAGSAADHVEALFRLHGARWQGRGETGVLADAAVRDFHRAALPGLVAHDLLRSYVLRIEGQVAGLFYGLSSGTRLFAYLGGFDPAFGFESPGTVLMGHAIEDALGENMRELHLLRGQEAYKYEWGAVDRWSTCRTFCRDL